MAETTVSSQLVNFARHIWIQTSEPQISTANPLTYVLLGASFERVPFNIILCAHSLRWSPKQVNRFYGFEKSPFKRMPDECIVTIMSFINKN